jgi:hypothetical protein
MEENKNTSVAGTTNVLKIELGSDEVKKAIHQYLTNHDKPSKAQ